MLMATAAFLLGVTKEGEMVLSQNVKAANIEALTIHREIDEMVGLEIIFKAHLLLPQSINVRPDS